MRASSRDAVRVNPRDVDRLTPRHWPLWPWLMAALLVALAWWVTL